MYVVTDEQAHEGIRGESMGTKKGLAIGCQPKLKLVCYG